MRPLPNLLLACVLLSACSGSAGDWRADAIAAAEARMRGLINDPAATFSHVDLTGGSATGQTCGVVISKVGIFTKEARFIVYIDGAGPYVEPGLGSSMSQADFDWAWKNDCVSEGYKS
ncbi:hypothetical protein FJ420_29260 [Mesorhizobium sp. B3-1-3]|uniref:hypothetical protein n=1 Tax=unclassified Mesorhizobium TaxID=325217 RepID=UPI001127AAEA|nr:MULTISPECIES: hypothetical protein [unclassified Mesorhizobium]TPI52807.1 hypothetical protein FJ424_32510 [Mesorhizobium sp. B3-1-8]TPI62933.1 hypothetical protein FJ420_29260 [Mesorhizobium sp. B3-1-3]